MYWKVRIIQAGSRWKSLKTWLQCEIKSCFKYVVSNWYIIFRLLYRNNKKRCRSWGSLIGGYEEPYSLRHNGRQPIENQLTFRGNMFLRTLKKETNIFHKETCNNVAHWMRYQILKLGSYIHATMYSLGRNTNFVILHFPWNDQNTFSNRHDHSYVVS